MECIIPGANMKVMVKAVQALSRIGDEIYFQAKEGFLSLVTINMSRTAYITINFLDAFFSYYTQSNTQTTTGNTEGSSCKISIKAISSIFKGLKEKNVELCKIEYGSGDKMKITLKYKYDITMIHSLRLLESESLTISVPDNDKSNHMSAQGSLYTQLIGMFSTQDQDITWNITKSKAIARNYDSNSPSSVRTIRTQVVLNASEFGIYKIENETNMTFSLKPFRAAIQFAESFNLNVEISFQIAGRPAIIFIKNPLFDVQFIISTLNPDNQTQTTVSSSQPMQVISSRKKTNTNQNITVQDKSAIESVDWEDGFGVIENPRSRETPKFLDKLNRIRDRSSKSISEKSSEGVINGSSKNISNENVLNKNNDDESDDVPPSPESPKTKRARLVFQRCFEPTFHQSILELGEVLAPNSDPESD